MSKLILMVMLAALSNSAWAAKWKYETYKDEMTGRTETYATKESDNTVKFKSPYKIRQHGNIMIINDGEEVLFSIPEGKIKCSGENEIRGTCSISVKFDKNKAVQVGAKEFGDDSTTIEITEPDFLKNLIAAKKIRIQVEADQNGRPEFTFDVRKLKIKTTP
jgi:hypothetical protein